MRALLFKIPPMLSVLRKITARATGTGLAALLDRDHSLVAFNRRVLHWAQSEDVPLLERLRFLCIVSSNLDEFFEVRTAPHLNAQHTGQSDGVYSPQSFQCLMQSLHALVQDQYTLYNQALMPALAQQGLHVLSHGERTPEQRKWVHQYFEREVKPLLVPVLLDPAHPFPQVANKSLNFIVRLGGRDAFGRDNEISIVKVPRVLPRLIRLPDKLCHRGTGFVSLSSVIRAHLTEMFPGRAVTQFSQFRVTRHSDLAVDEDDVKNLRTALRQGLVQRHYGEAVRLEVSSGCSDYLARFLLTQFALPDDSLFRVAGPVNLVRLTQLIDLARRLDLCFAPYTPSFPAQIQTGESIFVQLQRGDILIHQPFESFDGVLELLRQAVRDPQVLSIRQTIYRTGADATMLDLLREAVRQGKEVMAVVELKARFDEEANINWAEALESIGAQVVYGVVGLKTHAKMMLITRREGRQLRRYGHLSTGNYNPRTARLYTDLSQLTADPALTQDMEQVFVHLTGQSRLPRMRALLVAPFAMHKAFIARIDALGQAAARGESTRIVAKMNSLTDEALIRSLMQAAGQGVQIDLIVRGACQLPAGLPGVTDNIRVRSIIGRFLEHSRVFYFRRGSKDELFLSSADWMNRNMVRRVEVAWPVKDPVLRQRVIDECLVAYLHDGVDAWVQHSDGSYQLQKGLPGTLPHGVQQALVQRYHTR